jgi:biopolymer transport protein ExbD
LTYLESQGYDAFNGYVLEFGMRVLSGTHAIPESHGIDLAPMLDFVVNLLIFFIVTAVFVKQAGITVSRPTDSSGAQKLSKAIVIDELGAISIDAKTIDLRAVRAHVERHRAAVDDAGVVVVAHEHAPTGTLVAVVDEVHLAGIWDVTFTTAQ